MHKNKTTLTTITFLLLFLAACQTHSSGPKTQGPAENQKDKHYEFIYDRFYIDPYQPPENNPLEKMLKEDLNINLKVNIIVGQYSYWANQFNSRVALGDLPDFVFLSRSDLIKHAQDGVIIPLDDYLKQYPNLKNRLDEKQWLLSSVNKNIYGFPNMNLHGPYTAMYIRKDWLEKLNLQMPKTTKDLFEVLHAFTYEDPDGNGQDDTIGFTTDNLEFGTLSTITNAFGLPQFSSTAFGIPQDWIDIEGELHFGPISENYRDYLIYMNQLMEAQVIDEDINAQTFMEYKQKMTQGQTGVVSLFLPQYKMFSENVWISEIERNTPEAEWVYLPPVKGPNGHAGNNAHSLNSTYILAITKKVLEEPGKVEKAMELLDYMYRNGVDGGPGGQFIDFGLENIHHKKQNGDVAEFLKQYFEDQDKYMIASSMWGVPHNHDVLELTSTSKDFELFQKMEGHRSENNIITNYFYGALPFEYSGDDYIREMSLKFIYGIESFDKWEEYVKTLNKDNRYELVQEIRRNELKDLGFLK